MELNKLIDHTLLKQDATPEAIEKLCKEALEYHFMSVCLVEIMVIVHVA